MKLVNAMLKSNALPDVKPIASKTMKLKESYQQ